VTPHAAELNPPSRADALVFGAHPDDAELFCGGTIARMVARGRRVVVADLSDGERGTRGSRDERRAEGAEAARVLGVERRRLDCGDTRIENTEANRIEAIRMIRDLRPPVVLTHGSDDRHPDHRKAHALVRDAVFYAGVGGIETGQAPFRPPALLCFVGHLRAGVPSFQFVVDVTEFFPKKLEALRAFRSQFFNPDYEGPATFIAGERFWRTIEARARVFGALINVDFGEAFASEGPLPLDDPAALFAP
jgi:bacillithiol biosynthesis deacetylase BshB1